MSEQTKIQWCDSTLNFWRGCTKVSAGCANCYAEKNIGVKMQGIKWGKGQPRVKSKRAIHEARVLHDKPWVCDQCGHAQKTEQIDMYEDAGCSECGGKTHRRRIFSLSLGDWLDPEVPIEWLAEMLNTIHECFLVEWILCTKRPELWRARVGAVCDSLSNLNAQQKPLKQWLYHWLGEPFLEKSTPPRNITILTSVEDQKAADERIPALLKIPAARRGLSCEPLLGPVDIGSAVRKAGFDLGCNAGRKPHEGSLEWVIIGGESGPKARPCNVDWIRSLVSQCKAAGVAAFVKQMGSNFQRGGFCRDCGDHEGVCEHDGFACHIEDPKGGEIYEWPVDLRVREFPQ